MSKLNLKSEALSAYDAARESAAPDWRGVAELLRAALGDTKAKRTQAGGLADYHVEVNARKLVWPSPVIAVTFADGESVRMSFACLPGKPLNVGRGLRVACAAYVSRMRSRYRAGAGERIAKAIAESVDMRIASDAVSDAYKIKEAAAKEFTAHTNAEPEFEGYCGTSPEWCAWSNQNQKFKAAYNEASEIYETLKTQAGVLAARVREELVRADVPPVPAVVACHVEVSGETVATFEAADCNAALAVA